MVEIKMLHHSLARSLWIDQRFAPQICQRIRLALQPGFFLEFAGGSEPMTLISLYMTAGQRVEAVDERIPRPRSLLQ